MMKKLYFFFVGILYVIKKLIGIFKNFIIVLFPMFFLKTIDEYFLEDDEDAKRKNKDDITKHDIFFTSLLSFQVIAFFSCVYFLRFPPPKLKLLSEPESYKFFFLIISIASHYLIFLIFWSINKLVEIGEKQNLTKS